MSGTTPVSPKTEERREQFKAWARREVQDEIEAITAATRLADAKVQRYRRLTLIFMAPFVTLLAVSLAATIIWAGHSFLEWRYSLYSLTGDEVCQNHGMQWWLNFEQDESRTVLCLDRRKMVGTDAELPSHAMIAFDQSEDAWYPVPEQYSFEQSSIPLVSDQQRASYLDDESVSQLEAMCRLAGGHLIMRSGGVPDYNLSYSEAEEEVLVRGVEQHIEAFTWCQGIVVPGQLFFYSPDARWPFWHCQGEEPEEGKPDDRECGWKVMGDQDNSDYLTMVSETAQFSF